VINRRNSRLDHDSRCLYGRQGENKKYSTVIPYPDFRVVARLGCRRRPFGHCLTAPP